MNKKISLLIILVTGFILLGLAFSCYASDVRLMGMGDMQGIVEDESDYERDLTSFDFQEKGSIQTNYSSNYFSDSLPQNNTPSIYDFVVDLERKGTQDQYQVKTYCPISSSLAMSINYSREQRDLRSSYINSGGNFQTLSRTGKTEQGSVILGYAITDWFNLGLSYDNASVQDDYSGSEIAREGVIAKENSNSGGVSYGLKLYNPAFWFNFALGDIKTSRLSSITIATTEVYNSSGPSRVCLFIGGKLFDGRVRLNYGAFGEKVGYGSNVRSLLGSEIRPFDGLLIGLGYTYDADSTRSSYDYDLHSLAAKVGFEYSTPFIDQLKLRGGFVSRENKIYGLLFVLPPGTSNMNSQDYTLGLGYDWEKIKLDFAYKNYQDVFNNGMTTTSTPLSDYYIPSFSKERSSVYVFSMAYEI